MRNYTEIAGISKELQEPMSSCTVIDNYLQEVMRNCAGNSGVAGFNTELQSHCRNSQEIVENQWNCIVTANERQN